MIVSLILLFIVSIAIRKEKDRKNKIMNLLILFIPVLLENILISSQIWHIDIISILMLTAFIMNDTLNKNKIIKILAVAICVVQIGWSVISINFDAKNNYSASKDVANFIKENNYKTIYGYGYDIVAIQPYFSHNIYKNLNTEQSIWIWSANENKYVMNISTIDDDVNVYIFSDYYLNNYKDIYEKLKEKGYKKKNLKVFYLQKHIYMNLKVIKYWQKNRKIESNLLQ